MAADREEMLLGDDGFSQKTARQVTGKANVMTATVEQTPMVTEQHCSRSPSESVRSLIEASRSVRHLSSGSMISSWLALRSMLSVIEPNGPTALVYPASPDIGLFDLGWEMLIAPA